MTRAPKPGAHSHLVTLGLGDADDEEHGEILPLECDILARRLSAPPTHACMRSRTQGTCASPARSLGTRTRRALALGPAPSAAARGPGYAPRSDLAHSLELQLRRQAVGDVLGGQKQLHRERGEQVLLHSALEDERERLSPARERLSPTRYRHGVGARGGPHRAQRSRDQPVTSLSDMQATRRRTLLAVLLLCSVVAAAGEPLPWIKVGASWTWGGCERERGFEREREPAVCVCTLPSPCAGVCARRR